MTEGYVNIVGRIKDMVIRGGENVYPREIEEFLYRHPKIQDVQVFGVPDTRFGEELCAWIKVRAGETLTADEVRDVLPRPDRALQGAAAHPFRRRIPDDGDREDAEIHHARADDGGAGGAGGGDGLTPRLPPPLLAAKRTKVGGRGSDRSVPAEPLPPTLVRFAAQAHKGRGRISLSPRNHSPASMRIVSTFSGGTQQSLPA